MKNDKSKKLVDETMMKGKETVDENISNLNTFEHYLN